MRKINILEEIEPELIKSIRDVIHDFNNLHFMMINFIENEDNPSSEYRKEHNWKFARKYYEREGKEVRDKVKIMSDILYEKEEE